MKIKQFFVVTLQKQSNIFRDLSLRRADLETIILYAAITTKTYTC